MNRFALLFSLLAAMSAFSLGGCVVRSRPAYYEAHGRVQVYGPPRRTVVVARPAPPPVVYIRPPSATVIVR